MIQKTINECIDCDLCKKNCLFLQKYDVNLKGFAQDKTIAKSCFLCDMCNILCPKDLSGKQIALEHRRYAKNLSLKPIIKNNYIFKNNSSKKSKYLLFLGCNYPSTYPKTCEKIIEICKNIDIDYSVDCCKKPVYEMGKIPAMSNIEKLIEKKDVNTLICTCPNCYYFFKDNLKIEVMSVYEFFYKNNIGQKINEKSNVFTPCIDKKQKQIFKYVEPFLTDYELTYEKIMCCGLGGGAKKYEKDIIENIKSQMLQLNKHSIYSYCASCSIMFTKYGLKNIHNILSDILCIYEEPNYSVKNTIKAKLKIR